MSKAEILAELPRLRAEELAEVQAKLDELIGSGWQDRGELSDADKHELDVALADSEKAPDAGDAWKVVKARIEAKLNR